MRLYLDAARATTDDALADEKTWRAITQNSLALAKLSDTKRKRDEFLAKQISTEQWLRLLGALAKTVQHRVPDEDTRRAIASDLRRYLNVTRAAEPQLELRLLELESRGGLGQPGNARTPTPDDGSAPPRPLNVGEVSAK